MTLFCFKTHICSTHTLTHKVNTPLSEWNVFFLVVFLLLFECKIKLAWCNMSCTNLCLYENSNESSYCFICRLVSSYADKPSSSHWLIVPAIGILELSNVLVMFCLCLLASPMTLDMTTISFRPDTSKLHWSPNVLVHLLSFIPLVMTPNTVLQGFIPIYKNGGWEDFLHLYCCCLQALPPFIDWPLLHFLCVKYISSHS